MIYYRRNFVSGASYFFTVNLADRKSSILVDHTGELRAAFRYEAASPICSRCDRGAA
jgi:REP-associated tyrosine transposase